MPDETPPAGNTNPPATPPAVEPPASTPPASPPATPPASPPATPPTPPAEPPKPPASAAPERYEFQLSENSPLQGAALEAFTPTFQALGLSQEHAQTLVGTYEQQMNTAREQQLATWQSELKADKEFGGANFEANVQAAQKAVARFLTPEDKAFLERTGLGNFPGLVKAFHRIGKAISEDTSVAPSNPPAPRTAKDIYNHPTSQAALK